jgi:hypothetical protein
MLVVVGEKTSKARARLKYNGLIPHDLLHSAAKRLRTIGVAESAVMAMGGWKTATFRLYAIVDTPISGEDWRNWRWRVLRRNGLAFVFN